MQNLGVVGGFGGLVGGSGLVFLSVSGVLNISNISIVSINGVGHSLDTAIREEDVVRTAALVALPFLSSLAPKLTPE